MTHTHTMHHELWTNDDREKIRSTFTFVDILSVGYDTMQIVGLKAFPLFSAGISLKDTNCIDHFFVKIKFTDGFLPHDCGIKK